MVTNNSINNETTNNYTVTNGNLLMDNTNLGGTTGVIEFGGMPFISNYGSQNVFIGQYVGNMTMSGSQNTAIGYESLYFNTTGLGNVAVGYGTLYENVSGGLNTAIGHESLFLCTGGGNTAVGASSLTSNTTGSFNCALGQSCAENITSGTNNVAMGWISLISNITGSYNVSLGSSSLDFVTSGSYNIAIGNLAGTSYTSSESSNIAIGNSGTVGESNVIRIGTTGTGTGQQSSCYIAGITGVPVTGVPVIVDGTGQLGVTVSSIKFKENVKPVDLNDYDVLSLDPVSFNYKHEAKNIRTLGLIAEDVHNKVPHLVAYNREGEPHAVKYHELPILLLAQIKKQQSEIEYLMTRLIALEEKIP